MKKPNDILDEEIRTSDSILFANSDDRQIEQLYRIATGPAKSKLRVLIEPANDEKQKNDFKRRVEQVLSLQGRNVLPAAHQLIEQLRMS